MSELPSLPAPIDLEHAQFDSPAAASGLECAGCGRQLSGSYFDINGMPTCEACRYRVEAEYAKGAGTRGFFKALLAGGLAAIAGFLLYWAIEEFTGIEFGLIAVVVGLMVGKAVRWGSSARGGWVYQTMAIALTYLAIASTYIPPLIKEARSEHQAKAAATTAPPGASNPAAAGTAAVSTAPSGGESEAPIGAADFLVALGAVLALAVALPFLAGVHNILGILILGFGVYEAEDHRPKLSSPGLCALAIHPRGIPSPCNAFAAAPSCRPRV